ncbi:MAG TPA: ATP-binding protein [Gemmatimonadaceae bacterium]|nr:ATP-binding protein [Gemmatimonadaceae bacterium]
MALASESGAAGRSVVWTHLWTIATGAAIVAGAVWLRSPRIPYLVVSLIATAVAVLAMAGLARRDRGWAAAALGASVLFCTVAYFAQRTLHRIEHDWPAYSASLVELGASTLGDQLSVTSRALRASAQRALDAPVQVAGAFDALDDDVDTRAERGLALYRRGVPVAWAGHIFTSTDSLVSPLGVVYSPFYVTLYAAVVKGESRAVATATVHASPPGDEFAPAIANRVARAVGLHAFEVAPSAQVGSDIGAVAFAPVGDTLLVARAVAPGMEEARLLALERVRGRGAAAIVLMLVLYLIVVWRSERAVRWRMAPLVVALLGVALVPLSTFSSRWVLFDPTVYYAEIGGPLTASIGALGIAAAIVLLALLLALRSTKRELSWRGGIGALVVLAVLGPLLLRELAAGVMPPPGGVSATLWIAWEVALFLVAAALLVASSLAGRAALRRAGLGLPPAVAPLLAAIAALLGPVVVTAPGVWPIWYLLLWVVVVAALVFSRAHRWTVLTAGIVAALGATTLTWSAGVSGRALLAERDVSGLSEVQSDVVAVLQRFAGSISAAAPPRTAAELVRLYVSSDLMGSGYPAAMEELQADGTTTARVMLAELNVPGKALHDAAAEARRTRETVLRTVLGMPGELIMLAAPHTGGSVTTVVVGPRTRLIPDDQFNALLGLSERESGPPPYAMSLLSVEPIWPLTPDSTRWYRAGRQLHGNRLVQTVRGPMRAHMEIDLRPQIILVQRATLVALFDLLLLAALWTVSALPEPTFRAWIGAHGNRWARSYRARLSLVLFGFFVLPALAFAVWSYQRLQSEDRQSRELLVRETLRSYNEVADDADAEPLGSMGVRLGTPLMVYRYGELTEASDPLFETIAPMGRFLPSDVYQRLRLGREEYTSRRLRLGDEPALFGYLSTPTPWSERLVTAAPARGSEYMLDQRRRDLGVLVLFATVLGALGALLLSRLASRSLARPIGNLREAALAIAAGESEPPLEHGTPDEFEPVFSAFRRMAADLGASRSALESAQRRTAAVLRNVASGVVALSSDGNVIFSNPRASTLLDSPLLGSRLADVSPALAERVSDFVQRGAAEEELDLEVGGRQLQGRLVRLTGGGEGVVLTLDDVTELARAQRVIAWGEMARQVAHEIKNPLTPIRLGVQHLRRAYGDARPDFGDILATNVERILAEIDRLDEIARSFSRYGMAPADRQPPGVVDVSVVARDVVGLEMMGGGEGRKHGAEGRTREEGSRRQELHGNRKQETANREQGTGSASTEVGNGAGAVVNWRLVGAEEPMRAVARADELREVLLNLLENARLAGASAVELRCARRDGRVVIEVSDDGSGVPAHVLPRLFEPHFSTRSSGSGLGLAMSRQLVESWGGAIAIASVEGEGTRVRIELSAHDDATAEDVV